MKVRIKRSIPQPGGGSLEPGLIHTTTEHIGKSMIRQGFAELFEGKLPRAENKPPVEPAKASEAPAAGGTTADGLDRAAIIKELNSLKVEGVRKNTSTDKLAELLQEAKAKAKADK